MKKFIKTLKSVSLKVANFQAKLVLSMVYFFILPIFVLFDRKVKKNIGWGRWGIKSDSLEDLKKQY